MNPRPIAAEWEPRYADRAENMRASEIRELLKLLDLPGIVSFAGGIPDPALFPIADAKAAYGDVLSEGGSGGAALQYSVSEGYLPLRQWIVRHMGRLGVACDEDNIVITCGSQQGLEFLGRLLLSPCDTALAMAPTYLGALQAFSAYQPRYDELRPDNGNRTPAYLCRRGGGCRRLRQVRLRRPGLRQPDRRDPVEGSARASARSGNRARHPGDRGFPPTRRCASRARRSRPSRRSTLRAAAASMPPAPSIAARSPRPCRPACASAGSWRASR